MQSANTTEQVQTILNRDDFSFRLHCGHAKPTTQVTLDDKDELIHWVWLHFVLLHAHVELKQLRKGLYQTLQFELLVYTHPNILSHQYHIPIVWGGGGALAASTTFNVTPEYLCDAFQVQYSENGTNNRAKEEAIIFFWVNTYLSV